MLCTLSLRGIACGFNFVNLLMKCINVRSFQDLSVEDLESKCYDKFDFRLEDLQILIAKSGTKGESKLKLCHMQKRK